jgi:hypothetical protein
MWLHNCEADESKLFFNQKFCDQPAICEIGGSKLCVKHFNAVAKYKVIKRADGSLRAPKG